MKLMEWKKADTKLFNHSLKEILGFVFALTFSGLASYFIIDHFYFEINNLLLNNEQTFFIKEHSPSILLILLLPFTFFLFIAFLQRMLNFSSELAMLNMLKFSLVTIPMFFIAVIPFNMIIESNLKAQGYSYCYWYTGPSVRNADVWMKDESFCLQDGSLIRSDVLDWFDTHQKLGTEPTLEALNKFINEENSRIEKEIYGQ